VYHIFISYRRVDSAGHALLLYRDLNNALGKGATFMDVNEIDPGTRFPDEIRNAVSDCTVLLAVIGRQWLSVTDPASQLRRIDNPEDYLRKEIALALQLNKVVIPLLVQGALMPTATEPPDELKPLATTQAHAMTDNRWDYDFAELMKVLNKHLRPGPQATSPQASVSAPSTSATPPLDQPILVPVGAALGAEYGPGAAYRLTIGTTHEITIQNAGSIAVTELRVVLFPSATYIIPNTMPQQRSDLHGTYWEGGQSVLSPGASPTIRLTEKRAPLRGERSVVGEHALSAPEEPGFGQILGQQTIFYSARLTMTYRGAAGRYVGIIWDLHGFDLNNWRRVDGPTEIQEDLQALTEKESQRLNPHVVRAMPDNSGVYDPRTAPPNTMVAMAAFVTILKNPQLRGDVAAEEQVLRRRLHNLGHSDAYIESAVQFAYAL
jgi:hypothetical protein